MTTAEQWEEHWSKSGAYRIKIQRRLTRKLDYGQTTLASEDLEVYITVGLTTDKNRIMLRDRILSDHEQAARVQVLEATLRLMRDLYLKGNGYLRLWPDQLAEIAAALASQPAAEVITPDGFMGGFTAQPAEGESR